MAKVNAPVTFRETVFDHSLSYRRDDEKLVEMTLTHIPGSTPFVSIATYEPDHNPDNESESEAQLTLEEARYLFAFLGKLDAQGLLQ